jgi:LysM repeat protein
VGSIAVLFNSTTAAILARNGLSDPSLIRVGQTLIIPAPSPETIPTGSSVRHVVQAGETLEVIAGYYRTTTGALLAQNPALSDPENLAVGTVLTVIAGSEAGARTHVVKPGETLGTIAESYGLTTQAVARANGLTDPSLIRVGQTLIIP